VDQEHTPRWVSPDEQIEALKTTIEYLRGVGDDPRQNQELRASERRLAEFLTRHAEGELEPIWDDGLDPA
jgi:hypothetical protein